MSLEVGLRLCTRALQLMRQKYESLDRDILYSSERKKRRKDDKLISGEEAGKIHTIMLQTLRLHYRSVHSNEDKNFLSIKFLDIELLTCDPSFYRQVQRVSSCERGKQLSVSEGAISFSTTILYFLTEMSARKLKNCLSTFKCLH